MLAENQITHEGNLHHGESVRETLAWVSQFKQNLVPTYDMWDDDHGY